MLCMEFDSNITRTSISGLNNIVQLVMLSENCMHSFEPYCMHVVSAVYSCRQD